MIPKTLFLFYFITSIAYAQTNTTNDFTKNKSCLSGIRMNLIGHNEGRADSLPSQKSHPIGRPGKETSYPDDFKQRLDSIMISSWNMVSGGWEPDFKNSFEFDSSGNTTRVVEYLADEATGLWIPGYEQGFTWNLHGNIIQQIDREWDEPGGQWINNFQELYTYNDNNELINQISHWWDPIGAFWQAYQKNEYSHDSAGNIIQMINSYWDSYTQHWIAWEKREYSWDTAGNMLIDLSKEWLPDSSNWINAARNVYSYDIHNNKILETNEQWDILSGQWDYYMQTKFTYNGSYKPVLMISYYWNKFTAQWEANYKTEDQYDTASNLSCEKYYTWNENTGNWEHEQENNYNYDNTFTLSELLLPLSFKESIQYFNHKLDEAFAYEVSGDTLLPSEKLTLYYSGMENSVEPIVESPFRIYPNPASDILIIQTDSPFTQAVFGLYDLSGRNIFSKSISGHNETISLNDIQTGFYIYQLDINGKTHSGKLVKR